MTGNQYLGVRGEPIAEGNFGAICEVANWEGCKRALKDPNPAADFEMVKKEARILNCVQGYRNVATLYGELDDGRGPCHLLKFYRLRDFYALHVNRAPPPAEGIRSYGRQLVEDLTYIHKAGIRHCDLKPENILVGSKMQLKTADFGLAEAGIPGYWTLGVVVEEEHADKIDTFSLGIIFYNMLARTTPRITTK
ncbi:hypothetical protein BGX30_014539 [Mortierella sp. GBA39]|nr:hypothetical protein BGX30_014539 [Mortierella sp. GBA39]